MPSGAWTGLAIIVISCLALIVTMLVARNERLKLEFEREYHLMLSQHPPSAQEGPSVGGSPSAPDDQWFGDGAESGNGTPEEEASWGNGRSPHNNALWGERPSPGEDALWDSPSLGQDAVLEDTPPPEESSSSGDSAPPESGTSSPNAAPSAEAGPSGEG